MKFIEFTISTTTEASELVSDILWNYTNYGVAICDVNDVIELIEKHRSFWDYIDEDLHKDIEKDVLVKAYVAVDEAEKVAVSLRADLDELKKNAYGNISVGSLETVKREVDGDDWIEIWRKHYRPMLFGKVWICPEWIEHEAGDGEVEVRIDSNMAFGTGEHETTSMCIELIQKYLSPTDVLIDVGCGSGILGISAIKLGAKHAILTDIDFVAVKSATQNCLLNGVSDKATVAHSNLLDDTSVVGDIVVANITADILKVLAKSILKNVKSGGMLIMSGIIHSRYDEVLSVYSSL
ncbi:MAG: 50S ribosomal protein L11 methyltransferase, partial [Clostridia bacterium]|nr:50S ribosomal protein L11 methyltransferase [Clostridia bacterium]